MTTPNGKQIAVALDALRSDARVWDTAADDLSGPEGSAQNLILRPYDVTAFATKLGVDDTYNQARASLEDVLNQAAQNFRNLASALNNAATVYQREDEQGMHRLKGIY